MMKQLRPAIVILLALTIITGIIYPLAITGIAQLVFRHQANGSIIMVNGKPVGSELIGQQFSDPKYFWGRLSDTGDYPYNAFNAQTLTGSSGSNYGPMNPALLKAVQDRIDALKAADPGNSAPIPVDLVTSSGSGLDPNISIAAALYQAPWVDSRSGAAADREVHAGSSVRLPRRAARERVGVESGLGWVTQMIGSPVVTS